MRDDRDITGGKQLLHAKTGMVLLRPWIKLREHIPGAVQRLIDACFQEGQGFLNVIIFKIDLISE